MAKSKERNSEGKGAAIIIIGSVICSICGVVTPEKAAEITTIFGVVYMLVRGAIKMTKTKKDDEILKRVEEAFERISNEIIKNKKK